VNGRGSAMPLNALSAILIQEGKRLGQLALPGRFAIQSIAPEHDRIERALEIGG
jgi:hypothetical protein